MGTKEDRDALPLQSRALLGRAIGRTLIDIERWLVITQADWVAQGRDPASYFPASSGATHMVFSDGLVHMLASWPSQLSVAVTSGRLLEDPYAELLRLSEMNDAPGWLRGCLGRTVRDVRVYVYGDDVPSDEARQAAVSYLLDSGTELFYCTYLHGRMDGDELLPGTEVPRDCVARWVSIGQAHDLPIH